MWKPVFSFFKLFSLTFESVGLPVIMEASPLVGLNILLFSSFGPKQGKESVVGNSFFLGQRP